MAVKIELLAITRDAAKVALYYPVTSPIAAANDPTREAAGASLSASEITDLRAGTLTELVKTVSLSGMDKPTAKARIEAFWAQREAEALKVYAEKYRDADLVGKAWDGTSWS